MRPPGRIFVVFNAGSGRRDRSQALEDIERLKLPLVFRVAPRPLKLVRRPA